MPAARERASLARELLAAACAIEALAAGQRLPDAVARAADEARLPDPSRAPVRDIAAATARRLGLARALADRLNARKPAARVAALQWVGLAELLEPLRAEAVIVDQAVAAARLDPGCAPAAGFLNATLRRFLRERDALLAAVGDRPEARWNFPQWWISQLRADHPGDWQRVLEQSNRAPPMTLRVNSRRASPDAYLARLAQAGRGARAIGPAALVLDEPCPVEALPGWADGWVSVQDAGAQMAAPLLAPRDGERVLDACAAPGGKTTHLLELADCDLLALDVSEQRLAPVRENLARLGLRAEVRAGDARRPADWWDGRLFDRILVDAPCSASGIVRRHPDIRWLRRRSDLATLSRQQSEILGALWPLLRPGGTLLYATCSVFRAEGEQVIDHFLSGRGDARRRSLSWRFADAASEEPVAQLLPAAGPLRDHDGFFYCLLEKSP